MAKFPVTISALYVTWTCFILNICRAQHLVHIQEGPLYRVKGYPMSISCNVSGLTSLAKQEFTFSVAKPENPASLIEIMSSDDPGFGYALFAKRVRAKEIVIERLSEVSAIFQIMSLQAEDAGTYECYTPNKLSTYFGTYSAQTEVHVIEDTIKASYSGPETLSISEGDPLQLECQVSSQTFQHTHLSVTWYLRDTTETRPIIALDWDLTVKAGKAFENRYLSGLVAMEKVEDTTYRLKMSQVQQSDSGEIYCQAEEWIQDPDRSWIRISYKNTTSSKVEVKRIEVPESSFIAQIKPLSGDLQEGDVMEIHCSIEAQNLPGRFFSMTWLKDNMEVAQIGPSGVLSIPTNFMKREKDGELRAVKRGDKAYVLTIQPVRVEDQGLYQCKASQEERTEKGTFNKGQSQLSSEETVRIRTKESGLTVVMAKQLVQVIEGETLQISCSVTGAKGLLSVFWQHKKSTSSSFSDIITLSREGVMGTAGSQYQQRGVRTFRPTAADFILELSGAVVSDSGEYLCTVSEWIMESNGNVKKVSSQQQRGDFSVKSIDSLVTAVLRSRETQVAENSVIKLICSVRTPKVLLAVTWKFTPLNSTSQKDIIFLRHTGDISYGDEQRDYQLETDVQKSGVTFTLKVLRASKRHQGLYQCQIDAYERDVQKAKKLSNPLAVTVNRPASKLSLSISTTSPLKIPANTNAKMDCLVTSSSSNYSRFEVTWIKGTQTLLRMEPEGLVTVGPETQLKMNLQRTSRQTFQLMIQDLVSTDSGQYLCSVKEWIQDPDGVWYNLDTKSKAVEIAVTEMERKLHIRNISHVVNITDLRTGFTVECEISSYSSDKSVFEVTWSRRQGEEQPMTIFTAYRNGTLHKEIPDRALVYNRPSATLFTLTVPDVSPSDNGLYQCQVVEWLHTASDSWRKVAEENSGELSVQIYPEDDKGACFPGITLLILICLLFILLVIVVILLIAVCKRRPDSKKQKDSLWAENNPLKPISGILAGEDDNT